jgi:Bestrophin, RFP-TM, chloride channel
MGDFMISLSTHAKRNDDGSYIPEADAIIDEVGASARIFHCLFWSSCARRFQCLATPVGMKCMADRGMMTPKQLQILQSLSTPYGTKHVACLEWMMITASQGMEDGCFRNSYALSRQLLETTCQLRSVSVKVVDSLKSGRPPLSYTHLVQVLVDCFIWTSPLALYAELGVYSILCVGLITLFYGGLLNMAKIFLDPLGNQHFTKSSINMGMDIGVLTRESNASTSLFKEHGAKIPL